MKKLLLASLLPLTLASCSDTAESPVIEITGFFINDNPVDYSREMEVLPVLKVNDEVTVSLKLDGNGEDLNTFIVKEEQEQLYIEDFQLPVQGVSSDKNFTKLEEGIVGFENGVRQVEVTVKARVQSVTDEDAILSFYLFSRAECDGAQQEIEFKTEEVEEASFIAIGR